MPSSSEIVLSLEGDEKWNGVGGVVNEGETPEDAAVREISEEIGVQVDKKDLHVVVKVVVTSKGKSGRKILYSVMFKNTSRAKQKNIDRHNKKLITQFKRQGMAGVRKRA